MSNMAPDRLASQVQLLPANLGIIAHRTKKQRDGSDFWNLFIGGGDADRFFAIVGFRLQYKQARRDASAESTPCLESRGTGARL